LLIEYRDGLDKARGVHTRTRQNYGYAIAALLGEDRRGRHTQLTQSRTKVPARRAFAAIENKIPRSVSEHDIKKCIFTVAEGHGPASAERARGILRNVFSLAVSKDLIAVNKVSAIKYQKSDPLDPRTLDKRADGLDHDRAPTDDEVRGLLTALAAHPRAGRRIGKGTRAPRGATMANGQDIYDLVHLLFSLGVRLSEALAIRWSDLNLGTSPVTVKVRPWGAAHVAKLTMW